MSSEISLTEGEADFHVEGAGQPCKTHYKIFGTFPSPSGVRPLIVLHGGPGVPHNYLLPIRHLNQNSIPVIFYDQLGCGLSTHLPHLTGTAGAAFWTPQLFLSEITNLLSHLKITTYSLLGNSWGGMLASLHGISQPPGLHKLIIADSPASMPLWITAALKLRSQLPQDVQDTLSKHEKDGTTDSAEYEAASQVFYERHLKEDSTVYNVMNGPNEFHITGTLKEWSVVDEVHKIKVPTLLINGKYDEAQDEVVEPFFRGIEKVKWVRFAESSHLPQLEEMEEYLKVVREFLAD
ncbi:proline iminopeptidase [Mollisia scopiformis]|uniref:Proline iminopeptidase n=1 Tax=Mollisia scopiformis TaxID=149040 RepID=A0A194WUS3_MOLSC|nr:proline iminopeptidase [Mollisia scopiformis]KUJ11700.1 proline iminopeptidase [Mollisia scopiformis]